MEQSNLADLRKVAEQRIAGEIIATFSWPPSSQSKEVVFHSPDSLADRVLLAAINYVGEDFYFVDGRYTEPKRHVNRDYHYFCQMASQFERDINRSEFRRAFCRLITYAIRQGEKVALFNQRSSRDEIKNIRQTNPPNLNLSVPLTRAGLIAETRGIFGFKLNQISIIDDGRVSISFREPFSFGTRRFHETCVRVLLKLGSVSDSALIADEFANLVAPGDLAAKIDEAIRSRDVSTSESLVTLLNRLEPHHPELGRLKVEIDRQKKVQTLKTSGAFNPDDIDEMPGIQFEELVATAFEKLGYHVESTPKSGDFGSDLIVTTERGSRISVQCKRFKNKVNLKAVQEVVGSIAHYQCDFGLVITNNSFLNSAVKLAESSDVELWDKDRLIDFLSGEITFSSLQDM